MRLLLLLIVFAVLHVSTADGTFGNPCTQEALLAGMFHHPYPPNPTKYIQCTEWGRYHVRACAAGVWDVDSNTCAEVSRSSGTAASGSQSQNSQYRGDTTNQQQGQGQRNGNGVNVGNTAHNGVKAQGSNSVSQPGNGQLYVNHQIYRPVQPLPQDGDPKLWFGARPAGNQGPQGPQRPQDGNPSDWFGTEVKGDTSAPKPPSHSMNGQAGSSSAGAQWSVKSYTGNGQTQTVPRTNGQVKWGYKAINTGHPSANSASSTINSGSMSQSSNVVAQWRSAIMNGRQASGSNQNQYVQHVGAPGGASHGDNVGQGSNNMHMKPTGHKSGLPVQPPGSYKSHDTQKSTSKSSSHTKKKKVPTATLR